MLKNLFTKKRPLQIGIEIGDDYLRGVCLEKTKHREYHLIEKSVIPWCSDDKESLPLILLQFIRNNFPEKARIVLSIQYKLVTMKDLDLDDKLKDSEILKYLIRHSKQLFGHSIQDLYLDFFRLKNASSTRIVVTRQSVLTPILNLCQKNNMPIKAIDVDIFALIRGLEFLLKYDYHKHIGIILIRTTHILFATCHRNELYFIKSEDYNNTDFSIDNEIRFVGALKRAFQSYHAQYSQPIEQIILLGKDDLTATKILLSQDIFPPISIPAMNHSFPLETSWLCAYGLAVRGFDHGN